jgi:hypothetical protein
MVRAIEIPTTALKIRRQGHPANRSPQLRPALPWAAFGKADLIAAELDSLKDMGRNQHKDSKGDRSDQELRHRVKETGNRG